MSQTLLKSFPAQGPSQALVALWDAYSQIFTRTPQEPESQNQEPLQVDCSQMLIEVPSDKQGVHPHGNPHHNKNHPNWQRPNNQKNPNQGGGQFKRNDIKVFQESGLSEDPDRKAWFYQDDDKQNQGPFSSKEMDTLLTKNIVDYQTRVALDSLEKFVRIEKIVKVYQQSQSKNQNNSPQIQTTSSPQKVPVVKNNHAIQEPFKQSQLAVDSKGPTWYYKVQNDTKGPLSTQDMDDLWKSSQVNEETKIAFETIDKFVKLEKIMKLAEESIAKQKLESEKQVKTQVEVKKNQPEERAQPQSVPTTQAKVAPQKTEQKIEKVAEKKIAQVPQPKEKLAKIEVVVQQKQPIVKQNANTSFQEQVQDDDEWTSVGPNSQKKKPKNTIPNAAQVPGLQVQIKGQTSNQVPKKLNVAPVLTKTSISQEQQQPEEDEWQEVEIKSSKKK